MKINEAVEVFTRAIESITETEKLLQSLLTQMDTSDKMNIAPSPLALKAAIMGSLKANEISLKMTKVVITTLIETISEPQDVRLKEKTDE